LAPTSSIRTGRDNMYAWQFLELRQYTRTTAPVFG